MAGLIRAAVMGAGVLVGVLPGLPAAAQEEAGAPECRAVGRLAATDLSTIDRDIGRVLQTTGALASTPALLRRGSTEAERPVCRSRAAGLEWALRDALRDDGLRVVLAPVRAELESNSTYRQDRNNGALRGGVGVSTSVSAGVDVRWRWLSASLAPRLIRDVNGGFATIPAAHLGYSPLAHPYHGAVIDLPQRFGTDGGTRVDPGQSYIRLGLRHFELGVSTENIWLGAAQVYPILISGTAGGFPHVFAGTVEPLDIYIGRLGMHAIWGRLAESDHFDTDPANDRRLFAAALLEFEPLWLPGLHVGIARVYHEVIPPEGLSVGYWLGSVVDPGITFTSGGNRGEGNAIGALLARWVLPSAGFEAYAEWSREDTPYDLTDLIAEPDWTQAYALGFQQVAALGGVRVRSWGELVHLGEAATVRAGKGFFSYYTHSAAPQGHTERGQLLGAAAGPGSDAQILGVDVFHDYGMSGLWLERTRTDEDTYYRIWARMYGESRHDVATGIGVRHHMRLGPVQLSAELLYNSRANRSFINLEDRTAERLVETNWGLRLRGVWRPGIGWPDGVATR